MTTERHSPEATGVLAKAASGALEYVPIAIVVNLARALDELHELNAFLVGLDSTGDVDLAAAPMSAPLALVIGAPKARACAISPAQHCDIIARPRAAGTHHQPQTCRTPPRSRFMSRAPMKPSGRRRRDAQ